MKCAPGCFGPASVAPVTQEQLGAVPATEVLAAHFAAQQHVAGAFETTQPGTEEQAAACLPCSVLCTSHEGPAGRETSICMRQCAPVR
jgi:hypothetical protein